jgi:hypothetical protein
MNPLNNFSVSQGVDSVSQRLLNPFKGYLSADQRKLFLKQAQERNDFKAGFKILPYDKDGTPLKAEQVVLLSDSAPHDMLPFGGKQRLATDWYPGNSEPTVQVLGSQENSTTIKGRFKAKRLKKTQKDPDYEQWRKYALYMQQQVDAIRIAGYLVEISLGEEWRRWAFIEESAFEMKTLADISYTITFLIVGFNRPKDHIIVENANAIPYEKNKQLRQQITAALALQTNIPGTIPKSFAEQLTSAISDVAAAVNLVTGFVDTVIGEVNAVKASVQRAIGLVKNAKAKISFYQRTIGGNSPEAGVAKITSISGAYANAQHLGKVSSAMFSLTALLASLESQLKSMIDTIPLRRHRVRVGETLQNIAMKYYRDSARWEDIYDHNKLVSVEPVVGSILEIPR